MHIFNNKILHSFKIQKPTLLNKGCRIVGIKLLSIMMILSVSSSAMAGTTTADFLKWERKAQVSYLQISILMAGTVASQIRPDIARCIDNWYLKSKELQEKRHIEIIKIMPKYAEYSPTAVILGFIEQACGSFKSS